MKLNKTLMIAALLAGTVFAVDYTAKAQDSTNTPPATTRPPGGPGARGQMNFDRIATQLDLTDDQKVKAKPLFEDFSQKLAAVRADTTLEQADKRAKYKEVRDDLTAKLKEVLTPEQLAKWQKMGPGNRRPPGGAGAPPSSTPPASTPPANPPAQQ